MKGWIKVHRYDDKKEYWIQISNITHVTEDDRGHALICTASDTPKILVMESLNEVLALIEEAESEEVIVDSEEKLQAVIDKIEPKSDFYKGLSLIKGYCSSLKNCKKCPLNGYRECPLKLSGRVPERWDLDNLYLTADTEEEDK